MKKERTSQFNELVKLRLQKGEIGERQSTSPKFRCKGVCAMEAECFTHIDLICMYHNRENSKKGVYYFEKKKK